MSFAKPPGLRRLHDKLFVLMQRMANQIDPNRVERFNNVSLLVQVVEDGKVVDQELCAACKYCGSPTQTISRTCGRCSC